MTSTAGHAAPPAPSLSLHPRVGQTAVACLLAAAVGAFAGDLRGGLVGALVVAIPASLSALALAGLGRREVSLMAAVALAAPCVRLAVSAALAIGIWLAAEQMGRDLSAAGFWLAFTLAALGTLAVETLGLAADFRTLEHTPPPSPPSMEAAVA